MGRCALERDPQIRKRHEPDMRAFCIPAEVRVLNAFATRFAIRPASYKWGTTSSFVVSLRRKLSSTEISCLIGTLVNCRHCAIRADASKPATRLAHRVRLSQIAPRNVAKEADLPQVSGTSSDTSKYRLDQVLKAVAGVRLC